MSMVMIMTIIYGKDMEEPMTRNTLKKKIASKGMSDQVQ